MPSEMYISNEELTRRLKAHNYNAPPVTASTRSVLLKKLESLDAEKKQRNKVVRGKTGFRLLLASLKFLTMSFDLILNQGGLLSLEIHSTFTTFLNLSVVFQKISVFVLMVLMLVNLIFNYFDVG